MTFGEDKSHPELAAVIGDMEALRRDLWLRRRGLGQVHASVPISTTTIGQVDSLLAILTIIIKNVPEAREYIMNTMQYAESAFRVPTAATAVVDEERYPKLTKGCLDELPEGTS